MIKRVCKSCGKKVRKEFNYCPYCGASLKAQREQDDFGFLGRDDSIENLPQREIRIPFGLNRLMNSLMKQLESQLRNLNIDEADFKIKVTSEQIPVEEPPVPDAGEIDQEDEFEKEVRNLPVVGAKSKVKRLADRIIYEIEAPGVRRREDVRIRNLAQGLEIRAYSKDKCYLKFIPLNSQVLDYFIEKGKVFVELKG